MRNIINRCLAAVYWVWRRVRFTVRVAYYERWYYPRLPPPELTDAKQQQLLLLVEDVCAADRTKGQNLKN